MHSLLNPSTCPQRIRSEARTRYKALGQLRLRGKSEGRSSWGPNLRRHLVVSSGTRYIVSSTSTLSADSSFRSVSRGNEFSSKRFARLHPRPRYRDINRGFPLAWIQLNTDCTRSKQSSGCHVRWPECLFGSLAPGCCFRYSRQYLMGPNYFPIPF